MLMFLGRLSVLVTGLRGFLFWCGLSYWSREKGNPRKIKRCDGQGERDEKENVALAAVVFAGCFAVVTTAML